MMVTTTVYCTDGIPEMDTALSRERTDKCINQVDAMTTHSWLIRASSNVLTAHMNGEAKCF